MECMITSLNDSTIKPELSQISENMIILLMWWKNYIGYQ